MKNNEAQELNAMLTHTSSLLKHIFWLKQDFMLTPKKNHIATAINYTDIKERREDFLNELINTIVSWVYNKHKIKNIVDKRLSECGYDLGNASSYLSTKAFSKFRPGHPQGQFGELLLFNFIQHFFEAIPILRKQRITTSIGHERYGADAIHYKKTGNTNHIILGESKCYISNYSFKEAFCTSLESIESTFNNIDNELDIYLCEDFIEPELEDVAFRYKSGDLANVHFEMVCIVAYNETRKINGYDEDSIKKCIIEIIKDRCISLDKKSYDSVSHALLKRINYIVFPIWKLDELLNMFQFKVGSQK